LKVNVNELQERRLAPFTRWLLSRERLLVGAFLFLLFKVATGFGVAGTLTFGALYGYFSLSAPSVRELRKSLKYKRGEKAFKGYWQYRDYWEVEK